MTEHKTDAVDRAIAVGMEEMVTALRADKDAMADSLNTANDVIASLRNDASIAEERHDKLVESLHSFQNTLEASREAAFSVAQCNARDIFNGLAVSCLNDQDASGLAGALVDLLETLRRTDYAYLVEEKVSQYFLRLVNSCDEDRHIRDEIIKEWTESGFITSSVDVDELTSIKDKVDEAVSEVCEAKTHIEYAEGNVDEAQDELQALLGKLE